MSKKGKASARDSDKERDSGDTERVKKKEEIEKEEIEKEEIQKQQLEK